MRKLIEPRRPCSDSPPRTSAAGACEYGKVAQTSKPTTTAEAPITPAPTPKTGG